MAFLRNLFQRISGQKYYRAFDRTGISLSYDATAQSAVAVDDVEIVGLIRQVVSDGLAEEREESVLIPWTTVYALGWEHEGAEQDILRLPPLTQATPKLRSEGGLSSREFSVGIDGWRDHPSRIDLGTVTPVGAVAYVAGTTWLLKADVFKLLCEVRAFATRTERDAAGNRRSWGRLRTLAVQANAVLDEFLAETIVLTPEKLDLRFSRTLVADSQVVTLEPWFEGAPAQWLLSFDEHRTALPLYRIPTENGIVNVDLNEDVQRVLAVVKGFPGRRCAGVTAERFIANPFGFIGPDSEKVLDGAQIDAALREAALVFSDASVRIERDDQAQACAAVVEITRHAAEPKVTEELLDTADEVTALAGRVRRGLSERRLYVEWRGYNVRVDIDGPVLLAQLEDAIAALATKISIRYADVSDLERYSKRISGIGFYEAPAGINAKSSTSGESWLPTRASDASHVPPGTVVLSVPTNEGGDAQLVATREIVERVTEALQEARAHNRNAVRWPDTDVDLSVGVATEALTRVRHLAGPSAARRRTAEGREPARRAKELLLRANYSDTEYAEERKDILGAGGDGPVLPSTLLPEVALKQHQLEGVAWLQRLLKLSPDLCRGALLADEMGLGKTLQLLVLIASFLEEHPDAAPILIVAPVALLENWKLEMRRFFKANAFSVLTLYGQELRQLREPERNIERQLLEDGFLRFLKPNWRGDSKVVLTTYETLRDLELSLAAEHWSMMICDEAQRIKNPGAMVTRSAKKQNVRFRIACTGTPVENSLQDLWCLFNFIQPGLLGSLASFVKKYRRPIECGSQQDEDALKELRALIEPQVLRRTKEAVARELPPKLVEDDCFALTMSPSQKELYVNESWYSSKGGSSEAGYTSFWQVLPRLREICADPRASHERESLPREFDRYCQSSPKLKWLVTQLEAIRRTDEKALIFCELRSLQRLLVHAIEQKFRTRVDVINGDTTASVGSGASRQAIIDGFQRRPGFGVLVLSPLAAGLGLNIQAANHVIHFVRMWNPAKEDQATDRAYRLGQVRPVHVYYPTVSCDDFKTFDVKLHELLEKKRELARDMLNGSSDLVFGEFSDLFVDGPNGEIDMVSMALVEEMRGRSLELLVAALWSRRGFDVKLIGAASDHGVDVLAFRGDELQLIQCKGSSRNRALLDWDGVKDVVAGEAHYRSLYPQYTKLKLVCVTNHAFNSYAKDNARSNNVWIMESGDIAEMLRETPLSMAAVQLHSWGFRLSGGLSSD